MKIISDYHPVMYRFYRYNSTFFSSSFPAQRIALQPGTEMFFLDGHFDGYYSRNKNDGRRHVASQCHTECKINAGYAVAHSARIRLARRVNLDSYYSHGGRRVGAAINRRGRRTSLIPPNTRAPLDYPKRSISHC